jgi:hypothetical protein
MYSSNPYSTESARDSFPDGTGDIIQTEIDYYNRLIDTGIEPHINLFQSILSKNSFDL